MSARAAEAPPRVLGGTARDFAWLYSPQPQRAILAALLDIEREIGAGLRVGVDHTVGHVRLAWWREEAERCAAGRPAHPATRALLAAVGEPVDPRGLVDAATWDLAAATFATRAELSGYCARWASAMTLILARGAAADERLGRALGTALRELELLETLVPDARAGRLRLPLDELGQAGIEPEALARTPWPPALLGLVAQRHRAARTALASSVAALPARQQPALRGLLVWAALAHRASRRAERGSSAVDIRAARRAARAGRIADAWRAWRAARLAARGSFRLEMESDSD